MIVSWFSAGVSSAVATKLLIDQIDKVIYIHIDDHHPDTLRFVEECEQWFGKPIERLQAQVKNVADAMCFFPSRGFGRFSPCTQILKRRPRKYWESDTKDELSYVWGMDCTENTRAENIKKAMPKSRHSFPLIEQSISKEHAHQILASSGIKRPEMYNLGYSNNNCVGCVKGGKGYWNHIRVDFPEIFEERAKLERKLGGSFIKDVYLDELDPSAGRHEKPIVDDCGIFCQIMGI